MTFLGGILPAEKGFEVDSFFCARSIGRNADC